ncbi:MAG: phage holin family protein [Patescibacteria group bacterium]
MRILAKWIIASLAILLAAYFVQGITVDGYYPALVAALVLGVLSITIKPIVKLLTLPLSLITLGLFSVLVNAFFFWIVSTVVKGFSVNGFVAAVSGSVIVSVVNYVGDKLISKDDAII